MGDACQLFVLGWCCCLSIFPNVLFPAWRPGFVTPALFALHLTRPLQSFNPIYQ
ncbi:hypothetical protein DL93DRAFT_2072835 [Clavulina sp. PMI_390]|nr:hypothetical protein DL93DRAFT_2072835 [Clavulina sp. PMI_390]